MPDHDAIILAGGDAERLGGRVKADILVGGRRLLEIVLDAVPEARTQVVVGPVDVPYGVPQTLEEPPGGGPVAALLAGLDAVTEPSAWTVVLACDIPEATAAVPDLLAAVGSEPDVDGWCLTSDERGPQWLAAAYRTKSLRSVLQEIDDPSAAHMATLVGRLELRLVPTTADLRDVDTEEDMAHWLATFPEVSVVSDLDGPAE